MIGIFNNYENRIIYAVALFLPKIAVLLFLKKKIDSRNKKMIPKTENRFGKPFLFSFLDILIQY